MKPEQEALLSAVDASPDEDAPRLALADWLHANGDPEWAEYIRLSLLINRPELSGQRRADAEARHRELFHAGRTRWLAGRPAANGLSWQFQRGLPEVLAVTRLDDFRKHAEAALAHRVRWVAFNYLSDASSLARCRALRLVRRLKLWFPGLSDDTLLALLRSPNLAPLEALSINHRSLTGEALAHLAGADALTSLRLLEVASDGTNTPTPAHVEALARSPCLAGLRGLWFTGVAMSDEAAGRLWASPTFAGLTSLRIVHGRLGPEALAGVGDGAALPALGELFLTNNRLGDAGVEAVARARRWSGLRVLGLSTNLVGDRGAAALAGAAHLAGLERLVLTGNVLTDEGARALARSPHLPGLSSLNLEGNLIGDAGMMALGRSASLSNVARFGGIRNPARPAVVEAVEGRFRERRPPLVDEPPAPPSAPAVAAAPPMVIGAAEEDGLVRAILADPRETLARSAYADWLEEQGKPLHAELMRLPPGKSPRADALLVEIAKPLAGSTLAVELMGGLISARVMLRSFISKKFGDSAPAWLRGQHVTEVQLHGDTIDWAKVGNAPAMAHVRALNLQNCDLGDEGAAQLAGAMGTASLCALSLRSAGFAAAGAEALARSPALAALGRLDLAYTRPTVEGYRALAEGALGQGLQHLIGQGTSIGHAGVAILARAGMPALVTLAIPNNGLNDQAAQALADATGFRRLRNLDLGYNRMTDVGARLLAESALFSRLKWVRLPGNFTPDGWRVVGRAAAGVPGLVLMLPKGMADDLLAEMKEMLGPRATQE